MDVFGIVYIIDTPQQFWSELEEILQLPEDVTLAQLDNTLRRFVVFCSTYHEQYLQAPAQLEHACGLLLQSELFAFHSERMREILLNDAEVTTDPHRQLILYKILLSYGRNKPTFLRAHKKWQPLIPLLMDHVLVEFEPEAEDNYAGSVSSSGWSKAMVVPVEARLRLLAIGILYEVCRVQKFSVADLKTFDDAFLDHLFELVEQTRHMQDETLNYSVIKLIVALNEQFMVASIQTHSPSPPPVIYYGSRPKQPSAPEDNNRVLRVLIRRLNSSKTFGENMIFMLNRASSTAEDNVMQLLILKILYLLFTTKGTSEYFYTNDLCVLVDVFLREILDLDEHNESLRHTYLRVLHPLLTRTQLHTVPYKRQQILRTLESLLGNSAFREVSPTTKRLVDRCLAGDWCVQLRAAAEQERVRSPSGDSYASGMTGRSDGRVATATAAAPAGANAADERTRLGLGASVGAGIVASGSKVKVKTLKSSKSVENIRAQRDGHWHSKSGKSHLNGLDAPVGGKYSNHSMLNLDSLAAAVPSLPSSPPTSPREQQIINTYVHTSHRRQSEDFSLPSPSSAPSIRTAFQNQSQSQSQSHEPIAARHHLASAGKNGVVPIAHNMVSPPPPASASKRATASTSPSTSTHSRAAPPPPVRRRKPPAVPLGRAGSGSTITTIASSRSTSSPLSRVPPVMPS